MSYLIFKWGKHRLAFIIAYSKCLAHWKTARQAYLHTYIYRLAKGEGVWKENGQDSSTCLLHFPHHHFAFHELEHSCPFPSVYFAVWALLFISTSKKKGGFFCLFWYRSRFLVFGFSFLCSYFFYIAAVCLPACCSDHKDWVSICIFGFIEAAAIYRVG